MLIAMMTTVQTVLDVCAAPQSPELELATP
jgi:hypothetical protein